MTEEEFGLLSMLQKTLSEEELEEVLHEICEYMFFVSDGVKNQNYINNLRSELKRDINGRFKSRKKSYIEKGREVENESSKEGSSYVKKNKRSFNFWIILLELMHGIYAEKLGVDEENPLLAKLKEKRSKSISSEILHLKDFYSGSKPAIDLLKSTYFKKITKLYSKISKSIMVYDYLERHILEIKDELQRPDPYSDVHDKIYKAIEEKISSIKGIRYQRFLALSIRYNLREGLSEDDLRKEIIRNISFPLFAHIVRCLSMWSNDPEQNESEESRNKNGFFMVQFPTRTYHYIAIDDGTDFLFEGYRYSKKKIYSCKPDILQIIEDLEPDSERSSIYMNEFSNFLREPPPKLSLKGIEEILTKLYLKVEKNEEATLMKKSDYLSNFL